MVKVQFILGLIGGIIGLLLTPIYILVAVGILVVAALAQAPQVGMLILTLLVAPLAAIVGIIGAILTRGRTRLGGIMLLASGAIPLMLGAVSLAMIGGTTADISRGLQLLYTLFFWNFILIAAGIISILKTPVAQAAPSGQAPPPAH